MTPDLKRRFALADEVGAPELWGEARRRAAEPEAPQRALEWPPGAARRMAVGALAFAVFAVAAVFAWELSHPDRPPAPDPGAMNEFDLSIYPQGWTRLSDPPEVRSVAATAWTGSEMLIWGGYEYTGYSDEDAQDSGFAFDPASDSWKPLPPSPLAARVEPAAVWTGREFLIWGGSTGECCLPSGDDLLADGAAFDPASRTWRMLPSAPIRGRTPFSVWTGNELIVWGSRDRNARMFDGAAYDPTSDTWHTIADGPVDITDGSAVWTGREMIVFGAALHGGNFPETETAIGAAYDPETDSWSRIADSELSPQASTAAWDGERMIAWDYENRSASYDPETDTWQRIPKIDIWTGECSPFAVALEGHVFGDYCGIQVLYSGGVGRWLDVSRRPEPGDVVSPIAAGPVAFVFEHDRRAEERRLFVYRPPAPEEDPTEVLEPELFIPEVTRDGEVARMPVVFPDGTEATVVYPASLDLAALGVQPDVSYVWKEDPPPRFPIVFVHDPDASIDPFVDPEGGSRLINTSEGGIEVFRARGNDTERRFWIRYRLPSWTVLVSVRDALGTAVTVAGAIDLRETPSGFPVVNASGPIVLAEGFGEAEGPQLAIGDAAPDPGAVSQLDTTIFLSPDGCTPGSESSGSYGSACLGEGSVFASIYGDRDFVTSVIEGVRVEDFVPA